MTAFGWKKKSFSFCLHPSPSWEAPHSTHVTRPWTMVLTRENVSWWKGLSEGASSPIIDHRVLTDGQVRKQGVMPLDCSSRQMLRNRQRWSPGTNFRCLSAAGRNWTRVCANGTAHWGCCGFGRCSRRIGTPGSRARGPGHSPGPFGLLEGFTFSAWVCTVQSPVLTLGSSSEGIPPHLGRRLGPGDTPLWLWLGAGFEESTSIGDFVIGGLSQTAHLPQEAPRCFSSRDASARPRDLWKSREIGIPLLGLWPTSAFLWAASENAFLSARPLQKKKKIVPW